MELGALQGSGLKKLNVTPDDFARRVKQFRVNAGFSQQDMASYIGGVSVRTISRWEQGQNFPTSRIVINRLMQCNIF